MSLTAIGGDVKKMPVASAIQTVGEGPPGPAGAARGGPEGFRLQARPEAGWESSAEAARIAAARGHRLTLASRYMNREPMLLEARRKMLYREGRTGGDGSVPSP